MRHFIVILAVLLIAAPSFATIPWTAEDAARARESASGGERPEIPGSLRFYSGDDLADLAAAAFFVASMQVSDTFDPEFGGIREGEHLPLIIQTDNTSESIWLFSRYFELSGDSSILGNLEASWTYVLTHPAYDEEGATDPFVGYYRVYNCAWAVRAQMKYVEVFGDLTYASYADSCASYLANNSLRRTGTTGFSNLVNPPVLAWAAGNLYEYGVREANALWQEKGWNRGQRVKNWVEADSLILSNEEWAMSGGAVMWGLLESYFREYPGEQAAWLDSHIAEFDTLADAGSWENAWNGWYALGMSRLEIATGDPVWGARHLAMTNYLRAFDDTDDDGGIQAQPSDTDTMDQAWVTSYIAFMGFEPLLQIATDIALASPPPTGATLLPNRPNPFNPATTISFRLDAPSPVVLDVLDLAGRRVVRLVDGERNAGLHHVVWNGTDRKNHPLPSGVYFYRIDAGHAVDTKKMILLR